MLQAAKYYYMNLHLSQVVDNLRFRFKSKPIVYGIRCRETGMMYIGSSFAPENRFHNHLVTGNHSNAALQADIQKYGLKSLTVHIFELVIFPAGMPFRDRPAHLHLVEQRYIDR
jgi:hypothetical protein